MFAPPHLDDLQTGIFPLQDFLTQIEKRFEEREPFIHAFVPERDRFARLHREAEILMGRFPDPAGRPRLFGTLMGVKDIFHVDGFPTHAGSRLPAEVLRAREAESVRRLKDAGALILGKTVTTEFSYFFPGPTRNPHDFDRTPGGSSSGSAAAVSAGFCQLALGTQTIGSVIRPASYCGVVGVKPTYDRVSREGFIPLSPSLDHVGFFTQDVEFAIHVAPTLYNEWKEPTLPLRKPRLGVLSGPYLHNASAESLVNFEKVCSLLGEAGYELIHIPLPADLSEMRSRHDLILSAEVAQVHSEWFQKYNNLYSKELSGQIHRGQQIGDDRLQNALAAREKFRADMRRTFLDHNIDLWICPSSTGAAPKGLESTGDPVMNLPWTQAGLPAINLPAGKNKDNLPLGLQLVGNWYKDESLIFWAKDLEKVLASL